jgi:hypothetical protein
MKTRILGALCALLASTACFSEAMTAEQASASRCRQMVQAFMEKIVAGDDAEAMELLRPIFPISKQKFDDTKKRTIDGRRQMGEFGKVVGTRLLREERVSDFLWRVTYVEKHEFHLLRWQFIFYRAANEWRLNSFVFDDNSALLFDLPPAK